jgi:formylmethanofuran dehydrogenase subunit E-like metal-binding protein
MSTQIFKKKIPNEYLFELLDKICVKTKDYYLINNISFKKGMYNNYIKDFFDLSREHYHISKRKYIDKQLTYNSFMTIVRQICNFNKIIYKNEIKYDRSSYDINYYIYYTIINEV